MAIFNVKNVEIVWRGITLQGFSSNKINISQGYSPSNTIVIGISGECFTHPNTSRQWSISSKFYNQSISYPILIQDNLNNIEDTLIVRDLNNGTTDIYTNCSIASMGHTEDGKEVVVTWMAVKRNGR